MGEKAIQDQWSKYGTMCWGCGRNNEHGLQIKSYWDGEETVATWHPQPYHLAFPGALNGGIIAALIDCHSTNTANAAANKAEGRELSSETVKAYVTGSFYVKYLKPAPIDEPDILRARVKEIKERKVTVTCSLFSEGEECVTGEVVAVRAK